MMKQIVLCLICLGLGWFGGVYFSSHKHDEAHASGLAPKDVQALAEKQEALVRDLKAQLKAKQSLTDSLNQELAKTRDSLALQIASAADKESETDEAVNPFASNMSTMAAEMMQIQNQEEVEKLKRMLGLTPDQLEALDVFYLKEAEQQNRLMQQMFSGKPMEEIQEGFVGEVSDDEYLSVSELLGDILTPEQLATYEANEEREALEEKEAMAYSQLSQIQRQFLLDDEQKDAVFAIFYEAEHELDADDWESFEVDPEDPDFSIKYQEVQNERLLEALSVVLTEDQLELQRKKLNGEIEMQRKAMSMFGEGFFVTPSEE